MTEDKYVTINVYVSAATLNAIMIETKPSYLVWVPKSLIHGADADRIKSFTRNSFRLMAWKAKELDL